MQEPYEILRVSKDATAEEIRKAYRTLAMQFHPDRNPDKDAEKRFIQINAAYNFLRNKEAQQALTGGGKTPKVKLHDWAEAYNGSLEYWASLTSQNGGFRPSGNWTISELEGKLMEFFDREGPEATIEIYSRRQRFQADGVSLWMSRGLLEPAGSEEGEQSGSIFYGLTPSGREYVQRKRIEE